MPIPVVITDKGIKKYKISVQSHNFSYFFTLPHAIREELGIERYDFLSRKEEGEMLYLSKTREFGKDFCKVWGSEKHRKYFITWPRKHAFNYSISKKDYVYIYITDGDIINVERIK